MGKHVKKYAKGYVALTTTTLLAVQSALSNGITGDEWITIALAFIGAIGVVFVENKDEDDANAES